MKRKMYKFGAVLIITLTNLLISSSLFAQTPEKMSYQAVIRNSSDALVTNTQIGMEINIRQGSPTGTIVYTETQTPTTNANGLVSIEIGGGSGFNTIDWSAGPYFLETKTDIAGGTNYTITGTSQLLSVPYALHAKTAETVTGGIAETDPIFGAWDKSTGISITENQISDLQNYLTAETDPTVAANFDFSGATTGDLLQFDGTKWVKVTPNYLSSETDPVFGAWDKSTGISITESQISDLQNYATTTALNTALAGKVDKEVGKKLQAAGTQPGQIQYWNGTEWVTVDPPTSSGKVLYFNNNAPQWGPVVSATDVMNATTGKIWMDRNLGATQVATSSTDAAAYGDLYQWGRAADGHQLRTSGTTSTLSTSDTPGHGNFITVINSPYDWRNPQKNNLWQGVSGINNPCPSGYRLPTEVEWDIERMSWSSNDAAGAFASPLKLPMAGIRIFSDGTLGFVGSYGYYWSSTVDGTKARYLYFYSSIAFMNSFHRANGYSVRCIKD